MASTTLETARNMAAGLTAAGISMATIHALGLTSADVEQQIIAAWQINWPIAVGFMGGLVQNGILWNDAIRRLTSVEGAIKPSDYKYRLIPGRNGERDNILVDIHCIDGRIMDGGIRVAGGHGRMGLFPTSVAAGALAADLLGNDTLPAQIALGYAVGSNLYSSMGSTAHLLAELRGFWNQHTDANVHFNAKNHWNGCGALAAGNPIGHGAKFIAHAPIVADIIAFPVEVVSCATTNLFLSPLVYLATGGHASLTASLMHSHIHDSTVPSH